MSDIYILKNGGKQKVSVVKMFNTHGAYLLDGKRVDHLQKVQLLHDSSTQTHSQTGSSIDTVNNANMLKRAVVGGVLTGGVGAVVGGVTAERTSSINSVTKTTVNTELTAELTYSDGETQFVLFNDLKPYHWLLSFVNQPPMTDAELENERLLAQQLKSKNEFSFQLNRLFLMPETIEDKIRKHKYYIHVAVFIALALVFQVFALFIFVIYLFLSKSIFKFIYGSKGYSDEFIKQQIDLTKEQLCKEADQMQVYNLISPQIVFEPKCHYELGGDGKLIIKSNV